MVGGGGDGPLFESRGARGRVWYKLYAVSVFVGVCLIWVYRAVHIPKAGEKGRWIWVGMFGSELFFGLYWVLTQSVRWDPIYHLTFKDRLSQRYVNELPSVDIFVCTADPSIEPPLLVINTVLSVMAYDYPPEKLSVYLSDDGRSKLTFYALIEAASFAKHWIPYCKKFNNEPRSPAAYFSSVHDLSKSYSADEFSAIKKLYKEMENRIDATCKLGSISLEIAKQHKGFSEWNSDSTPGNHQPIVEILIDRRDPKMLDVEGMALPILVYVAREKRPQVPHNFKAGALNALIRVSSKITDAPFILFVDCDMYSNNSESVRDALCFFMDEKNGHDISFVQFPQNFRNLHRSNTYGDYISIVNEVEFPGFEQAMLIGTGCFHRRKSLCGRTYKKNYKINCNNSYEMKSEANTSILEDRAKRTASCAFEQNTEWGTDMGMMYGCPVEDVITGLSIQCQGWRSIYFNPPKKCFLGMGPLTLGQFLVQHKRWSEGMFQIFISKYCPFIYGHGKIKLRLQMAYSLYLLWALISLPMLYYVIFPSLYLLKGIPLFPKVSSSWILPFAYVITATQAYSLGECLSCGETFTSWWNMQKMRMMRRTTSYLFSFIDTILQQLGFGSSGFAITSKVTDGEALERYEKGVMEFGSYSPMFVVLALLTVLNLLCLVGGVTRVVMEKDGGSLGDQMALQFLLSGLLVIGCMPIYQALFFRKDKGSLPASIAFQSALLAALACIVPMHSG